MSDHELTATDYDEMQEDILNLMDPHTRIITVEYPSRNVFVCKILVGESYYDLDFFDKL